MTNRIEAIRMRTALSGLALALLGAVALFVSPFGSDTAEADSLWTKCVRDGAAGVLGVAHDNSRGLVADCVALLKAKKTLQGKDGRQLNWSRKVHMNEWEGVTLSGSPLRVTMIELSGYDLTDKLTGKIPKQLGNLSELEYLVLSYNELSGEIPPQLGNLSKLEHLTLVSNFLTGSIPPQLSRLSKLESLDLGGNILTGKIPAKLGKLSNLKQLQLAHNKLSGELPKQLRKLSNLEFLLLRKNQLTGAIPKWLGKLPNLNASSLELHQNKFSGCVPKSLSESPYIRTMFDRSQLKEYQLPMCD